MEKVSEFILVILWPSTVVFNPTIEYNLQYSTSLILIPFVVVVSGWVDFGGYSVVLVVIVVGGLSAVEVAVVVSVNE